MAILDRLHLHLTYLFLGLLGMTACSEQAPIGSVSVHSLSTPRASMVSGGDALIGVRGVSDGNFRVLSDNQDVTDAFAPSIGEPGMLIGLVTGLKDGITEIKVTNSDGTYDYAMTQISNFPIEGPIFSGPHEAPFVCEAESFRPGAGLEPIDLGPVLDENCSIERRVIYYYKDREGTFKPYPDLRPTDMAFVSVHDRMLPYIVRMEIGSINRAIYQIAMLHDPEVDAPTIHDNSIGWNGRLIYKFGGGCRSGWYRQGSATGGVLEDKMLLRGYATASATLNVFGNNCNDLLTAETMMMVKERFIEAYGPPAHAIGWGCSGGSYQSLQIGDNYPGLLDGIVFGCTFPEVWASNVHLLTDTRLLKRYFDAANADGQVTWSDQDILAVVGYGSIANMTVFDDGAARIDPVNRDSHRSAEFGTAVPAALRYDPISNPSGARPTVQDHTVNVYGRDEATGFARRPLDNRGIQYGLRALNNGLITMTQFLDLNEKIGGLDQDANFVAERMTHDPVATRMAYLSGRILNAGGGLASMPMIDYRGYADLRPTGDIHTRFHSFALEARMVRTNGHRNNLVMLVEDGICDDCSLFSLVSPVLEGALEAMESWLNAIAMDESIAMRHEKVVTNKPLDLVDACWDLSQTPRLKIAEQQTMDGGACEAIYPTFTAPRIVAGAPIANDIIACQRKPIDAADYTAATEQDLQAISSIFPDGVCDWTKAGEEQQDLKGTFLSFGPSAPSF